MELFPLSAFRLLPDTKFNKTTQRGIDEKQEQNTDTTMLLLLWSSPTHVL